MSYEEQLQQPEWKRKRDHIIERDFRMCQVCMSSKNLQVHHKNYITGRMAWDYPDSYLIALCENHHKLEHLKGQITVLETIDPWDDIIQNLSDNYKIVRTLREREANRG